MKKMSPYAIIALSFSFIIAVGTILLSLPIAKKGDASFGFVDAFFISTSAVTITGLTTVPDLSMSLSLFGKIVLAMLVQIGGLSIVTLSVFVLYLIGAKIGLSNRILIKESLNQNSLSGMVKLVIRIVIFTLILEGIGFIINLFVFLGDYPFFKAVGLSAFHAISSFNNAGFDLLGSNSLQNYNSHVLLNLNTAFLIMIGGTGFIVINDIITKRSYKKLMIHSKIVIIMNLSLWVFGTVLFRLSSINKAYELSWLESFFLSVTARTAGFTTINMGLIMPLTTLFLIILMFIGASPASTGGGIKTTTAYTLLKEVSSYARGKQPTTHNRLISNESRMKALALLTTALLVVFIGMVLLLFFEDTSLDAVFIEVVSAFANVGLTKNLTPSITNYSKIVLCLLMFIGRVGPLTIICLFNNRWHKKDFTHIEYIEEKLMIG